MNNELLLNSSLYSLITIEQCIKDFIGLADIKIVTEENHYKCIFDNTKVSIERTILEFENYLISLESRKGF